jgi:hypothetical protein
MPTPAKGHIQQASMAVMNSARWQQLGLKILLTLRVQQRLRDRLATHADTSKPANTIERSDQGTQKAWQHLTTPRRWQQQVELLLILSAQLN